MISETRFARGYSSFWRSAAPTMELYVKRCNLDGYERNFEPIQSVVHPDRRAITNQIAFEIFSIIVSHNISNNEIDIEAYHPDNVSEAVRVLNAGLINLTKEEINEASLLAKRMWLHFAYPHRLMVNTKPKFKGCGIILTCLGDVLVDDDIIVEFKDGDRPFRSYEFRQLSVYSALYYREYRRLPKAIGVLNSRRGTYIQIEFAEFVKEISGRSSLDYVHEIIQMITETTITQ